MYMVNPSHPLYHMIFMIHLPSYFTEEKRPSNGTSHSQHHRVVLWN